MSEPLVSVCMPCRNAAPYVGAAVDSVLAQTYRNVEVVAVDDGSTDGTGAILDDYAARHGVRVLHATLGNAAKARNLAYRRSRGEYVKFFDADDLLAPEMIARQLDRLKGRPGAVASSGWARFRVDPATADPRPDETWRDLPPLDWLCESLRGGGGHAMMQCGMFLVPRALIDRTGGWDERLTLIDDLEFHVRTLLSAERVLHVDSTLYYRSGLPASLSGRKSREAYESAAASIEGAVDALLRADGSARVRAACADLAQAWYFEIAPHQPDLGDRLRERARELGGSSVRPSGGPVFGAVAKAIGWRTAARLRAVASRSGYAGLRRVIGRRETRPSP